jgi:hypothetical protein
MTMLRARFIKLNFPIRSAAGQITLEEVRLAEGNGEEDRTEHDSSYIYSLVFFTVSQGGLQGRRT